MLANFIPRLEKETLGPGIFLYIKSKVEIEYMYLSKFGDFMICGSKDIFKSGSCLILCTNAHREVTDLVNHGMVKNTGT